MSTAIFDLGLHAEQRNEISTWKQVSLKTFDIAQYSGHVTDLSNNAWRPLVIKVSIYQKWKYFKTEFRSLQNNQSNSLYHLRKLSKSSVLFYLCRRVIPSQTRWKGCFSNYGVTACSRQRSAEIYLQAWITTAPRRGSIIPSTLI